MSILSFKKLLNNNYFNLETIIKDIHNYWGHTSENNSHETLLEHSNLVLKYSILIIRNNELELILNNLIKKITSNEKIQNDIKLFYLKAIYWHDIGKINENFQKVKMKNDFNSIENKISSQHSILSTYLYLYSSFKKINEEYKDKTYKIELVSIVLYFSVTIWRHHTGLYKSFKELINDKNSGIPICDLLQDYISKLNIEKDNNIHKMIMTYLINIEFSNYEPLFLLSKSLFSLLIISDYYATSQFMNYGNKKEIIYNNFGLIEKEFTEKLYKELYIDKFDKDKKQLSFNEQLKNKTNNDFDDFTNLREKNNKNLNHLRNKLFVEVRENLINNIEKNLFYIEAPTGSGKTNLSIMSAVEILKRDNSIKKIFYVFPFTTLITQTYDSIKNLLQLNNNEIVQLHSKAKYNQKIEEKEDGMYGNDKTNFLDNQFMNYPITMLSHVKFFDILTGISKDSNYLFHRMANSIVIIDEIQTYNPEIWSYIVYLFDMFAKNFNIKFIVMSATLPKIGEILKDKDFDDPFYKLVTDKSKYFQNPNFAGRLEKIKEIKDNTNEKIYKTLLKESNIYKKNNNKVKTIIEFITKKGADQFYSYSKAQNNKTFDKILILSGTILEPRRKEIINFLKDKDKNESTLLITTQVVEAGVDIDMDIGFKEKSLVDSDEQLAGRINRNSSKEGNKLFLFKMEKENYKYVYKSDKRKNITSTYINEKGEKQDVLKTKDFDKFYSQVIEQINKNNDTNFIENLNSYIDDIKNLRFAEIQKKTRIIDMKSLSIFVPLELDSKFFKNDKELLEKLNIYDKKVSGVSIWKAYSDIIHNQEMKFIDKKIELKKFSSLLSKFTFSLADYHGSGINYLKEYGKEEYGYLYLENYSNIYNFNNGLDTNILKGNLPKTLLIF